MPKPDTVPGQAHPLWDSPDGVTSDGSQAPLSGARTAGWAPGFKPPAQWFNWFWRSVSRWLSWLDRASVQGPIGDTPARIRYLDPEGEFSFREVDTPSSEEYATVESGGLRLREPSFAAPDRSVLIRVPVGWEAAAGTDAEIAIPAADFLNTFTTPQLAVVETGVWTPGIDVGGVPHASFSSQDGWWARTGTMIHLWWSVIATGFSASLGDPVDLTGIPSTFLDAGFTTTPAQGPLQGATGLVVPEHYPVSNITAGVFRLRVTQGNTVASWPATSGFVGQISFLR